MSTYKFKTNINCQACINRVQQSMDEVIGKENWQVDTASSDKVLTVTGSDEQLVIDTLKKVGYTAQAIS